MTPSSFLPDSLSRRIRSRLEGCPERRTPFVWPIAAWAAAALVASLVACSASTHATRPAKLGQPGDMARMERLLAERGPIRFERVVAADWVVARSGLVNLDHPKARAAGLEDGPEPIEIFFYVLEHPTRGDFLVDSGVASGFRDEGGHPGVSAIVEAAMNIEALEVHVTTAEWLASRARPPAAVFLTHLHLDHVMGLPDVPDETAVYVGPGETEATGFLNLFSRGTIDRMLAREAPLREWAMGSAPEPGELAALDVFGDASLWALHVPGHTPGSMAFVVRTTEGPRLLVGDTSHTRWGWENGVEPGTFTADAEENAARLAALRRLADAHPEIEVHLGHQRLDAPR